MSIFSSKDYTIPHRYSFSISRPHPPSSDKAYWLKEGQNALREQLLVSPKVRQAKNIILFLGDGMSIPTVTASRYLKGQKSSRWEHEEMAWDKFPYSALIKVRRGVGFWGLACPREERVWGEGWLA